MSLLNEAQILGSGLLRTGENALTTGWNMLSGTGPRLAPSTCRLAEEAQTIIGASPRLTSAPTIFTDALSAGQRQSQTTSLSNMLGGSPVSGSSIFSAMRLDTTGIQISATSSDVNTLLAGSSTATNNLVSIGNDILANVRTGETIRLLDRNATGQTVLQGTGWETMIDSPRATSGSIPQTPRFNSLLSALSQQQAETRDVFQYVQKNDWRRVLQNIQLTDSTELQRSVRAGFSQGTCEVLPATMDPRVRGMGTNSGDITVQIGDTRAIRTARGEIQVTEHGNLVIGDVNGFRQLIDSSGRVEAERLADGTMRYPVDGNYYITRPPGSNTLQVHDSSGRIIQEKNLTTVETVLRVGDAAIRLGPVAGLSDFPTSATIPGARREVFVGVGVLAVREGDCGFVVQSDGRALAYSGNEAIRRDLNGLYFLLVREMNGRMREERIDPWQLPACICNNLARIARQIRELAQYGYTEMDGQRISVDGGRIEAVILDSETNEQALVITDAEQSSVQHNNITTVNDQWGHSQLLMAGRELVSFQSTGAFTTPYGQVDPHGTFTSHHGWRLHTDGRVETPTGTQVGSDGSIRFSDGTCIGADGTVSATSRHQQQYLSQQASAALAIAAAALEGLGSKAAAGQLQLDDILAMQDSLSIVQGLLPAMLGAGLPDVAGALSSAAAGLDSSIDCAIESYTRTALARAMRSYCTTAATPKGTVPLAILPGASIACHPKSRNTFENDLAA